MKYSFHSKLFKHFLLLYGLLQVGVFAVSHAQHSTATHPFLDTAAIDALNRLSYHYITLERKDSANHFALAAYTKARAIHYYYGVAVSLSLQSQIAKHFDDDFIQSEQLGKASLQWFAKTHNQSGIDTLYNHLVYTLFAQSKFDEALQYTQKMYALAKTNNDQEGLISALSWMFAIYRQSGNYEKSFHYVQQLHDVAVRSKNKVWTAASLYALAQQYMLIEDYPHALHYFRQVLQMDDNDTRNHRILTDNDIWFKMEFTEVFSHLGQFDSPLYRPPKDKAVYWRVYWASTGECYLLQHKYPEALHHFELGLAEHQKRNDRNEVMRTLLNLGKTHLALNNNDQALLYGRQGLLLALQTKAKQYARDGYQILATVYERLQQPDSANFYFIQYTRLKEDVLNNQARGALAAYKYEQQIALLNKEKEIQQVRLQQEALTKKVLVFSVVFLALLGFTLVRNIALKRKNEKQQFEHEIALQKKEGEKQRAALLHRATELQMQALRAQMNPHFIFNSLNSINYFILQNEKTQAPD